MQRTIVANCLLICGLLVAGQGQAGIAVQRQPQAKATTPLIVKSAVVPRCTHRELNTGIPNLGLWDCPAGWRAQVQTATDAVGFPYVASCTCVSQT